jgi:hypothetical protein
MRRETREMILLLDIIKISNYYTFNFDITHSCVNMEWRIIIIISLLMSPLPSLWITHKENEP